MVVAPYNANPELVAMKDDFADRKFRVKLIGMAITAAFAVAAAATLFALPVLAPQMAVGMLPMAKLLIGCSMAAASWLTSMITMKEVKKLEIDEKFITSYMQGKNYWGEGYREEVAEHGYALQSPTFQGAPPPSLADKNLLQRS